VDFDLAYNRIDNVLKSVVKGWFAETTKSNVVDKNRGWLRMAEMLNDLQSDWRILVCVRDLTQIYGSIEAQHAKTRFLNFADGVGGPLGYIRDIQDIRDTAIHDRIQYVPFEYLTSNPAAATEELFDWLGLKKTKIDPNKLTTRPHESDSYYRFKYRHETRPSISSVARRDIPPRVEEGLRKNFKWYFDKFYP
jgi:sulfotransferase